MDLRCRVLWVPSLSCWVGCCWAGHWASEPPAERHGGRGRSRTALQPQPTLSPNKTHPPTSANATYLLPRLPGLPGEAVQAALALAKKENGEKTTVRVTERRAKAECPTGRGSPLPWGACSCRTPSRIGHSPASKRVS